MATKAAYKRLTREYKLIQENPTPYITAKPSESHILEWHYVITGPPDTPYEGGQYHGTLVFPADYPFKPPSIRMMTPSGKLLLAVLLLTCIIVGRFKTNTRLCLSISDYHPKTWNPAWSVSTILTGLQSFMNGDETTAGSITTSDEHKRKYAKDSHRWNLVNNSMFNEQFPDLVAENRAIINKQQEISSASAKSNKPTTASLSNTNSSPQQQNPEQQQQPPQQKGFLSVGKVFGICIVLVSWILASRMFGSGIN